MPRDSECCCCDPALVILENRQAAYGFNRSALEMEILRALLIERRIEAYEAGGALAPAQQVFCQEICSKVIQSQFCVILLNNERAVVH